jgi:hypothetical protein
MAKPKFWAGDVQDNPVRSVGRNQLRRVRVVAIGKSPDWINALSRREVVINRASGGAGNRDLRVVTGQTLSLLYSIRHITHHQRAGIAEVSGHIRDR